jgi:acetyl esterase/lipase
MDFSQEKKRRLFLSLFIAALLLLMCGLGLFYFKWIEAGRSSANGVASKLETSGVVESPAEQKQVALWPGNLDLAKPDTGNRAESAGTGSQLVGGRKWHWVSFVTRPTMTIYKPRVQHSGAAVLIFPGGGFRALATDLEGTEVCNWVVRLGMTCVMLKYRVPQEWPRKDGVGQRPARLLALEDAQRAMGLLRQNAAGYGIDPNRIGVLGFSAGAYLAAEMSNTEARAYPPVDVADRQPILPDFAIIAYTARMLDSSKGKNSLELQPWVKISSKAPPTLIIHAMNDPIDNIRHPMAYALALNEAGVAVDMRIYAKGGHAFGMRPTDDPITKEWPGQVKQWLHNIDMLATGS